MKIEQLVHGPWPEVQYGMQTGQHVLQVGYRGKEARGKTLACWCKPGDPCHADVLLEIANRPFAASEGPDG